MRRQGGKISVNNRQRQKNQKHGETNGDGVNGKNKFIQPELLDLVANLVDVGFFRRIRQRFSFRHEGYYTPLLLGTILRFNRYFLYRRPLCIVDKVMDDNQSFYENYADRIYSFCYYRTGIREVAEDITSEAFLRFYSSDGWHKPNPIAYLYVICRNLIIDHYRQQHKTVSFGQFSVDDSVFGKEENNEQKIIIDQILESMKLLP